MRRLIVKGLKFKKGSTLNKTIKGRTKKIIIICTWRIIEKET